MDQATDHIYIEKVLQGDASAFAFLVERYKNMAFTIAVRIIRNHEDAEEAAQDAFLKAYSHLKEFKKESKFSTWLYTIVYNTAVSKTRKKKLETVSINDEVAENFRYEDSVNQLSQLGNEEQKHFIKKAIEQLQEDDALIITLYYMEEMSITEISEITNLTNSNVKVKLHRARKSLHKELQQLLNHELSEIL